MTTTSSPSPATSAPRLFRPHHVEEQAAERMRGIYAELVRDWVRLAALPDSAHQLRKWGRTESALRGIASLEELLDRIDAGDAEQTDALLLALVRLAQAGRTLAGRTVLQAMLPKLKSMAWRTSGSSSDDWDLQDRRQVGIAEFWEVLSTYPVDRRTRKVAANLALDTLRRLTVATRAGGEERVVDPHVEDLEAYLTSQLVDQVAFEDPTHAGAVASDVSELDSDAGLLEVMAWALEVGAISRSDAQLLVRVYAPAPGEEGGALGVAEQMGLTPEAVRQRCSRARRELIKAAHAHAEGPMALVPAGSAPLSGL